MSQAGKPSSTNRSAADRVIGIDAARAIAALSTVWLHTMGQSPTLGMTAEWGRFSVPFFNLIAGWFLVTHVRRHSAERLRTYSVTRFQRLYVPFLAWNLLYVISSQAKRSWLTHEPPVRLTPEFLLIGTAQHMWYLPFLLLWSVAAFVAVRWALGRRVREVGLGAVLVGAGVVIALFPEPQWYQHLPISPYFLERTWVRVPSLLWGLGAGLLATPAIRQMRVPAIAAVLGIGLTVGCVAAWETIGHRPLLQNTAGIGLVLLGVGMGPSRVRAGLAWVGRYGFGIFLAHTFFIETTRSMAELLGLWPATWMDIVMWVVATVASVCATIIANQSRWTRWALPM